MQSNLPFNAPIFTFSNDALITGFDKYICAWCKETRDFMRNGYNASPEETEGFLRENNYAYLVIDGQSARYRGINETNMKIQELISSGRFNPAYQNSAMILLSLSS